MICKFFLIAILLLWSKSNFLEIKEENVNLVGTDIFKCIQDGTNMATELVKLVELITKKASMTEILGEVSKLILLVPKMITDCFSSESE